MEPIIPRTIEVPGYAVLPIHLPTMVSNVVSAYCAGNRRPAFRSRLTPLINRQMLNKSLGNIDSWDEERAPFLFDVQKMIQNMEGFLQDFLHGVLEYPELVSDLGASNLDALTTGDAFQEWSSTFVVSPSLGYPRVYPKLVVNDQIAQSGTVIDVPSPCSLWNIGLAITLLEFDRGRFTSELIPAAKGTGSHSEKERPFGTYLSLKEQLRELQRVYMLYAVQGSLLSLHANRRILQLMYELCYAIDVRSRVALEAWKDALDYLLAQPVHPLLSVITNALSTGTVHTYYGVKDLIYRHGRAVPNSKDLDDIGDIRKLLLTEALADMNRPHNDSWGCALNADPKTGKVPNDAPLTTVGALARQIRSTGNLAEGWKTTSSKLAWSNLRGDVGQIKQLAADFILCDGEGYSDSPVAGLLGLRPVLSLGNIKVIGMGRRFQDDFNVEPGPNGQTEKRLVTFSAMVVDGYQSPTGETEALERLYIPAGMSMGEDNVTVILASTVGVDPLVKGIVSYFETLNAPNGQFVRQFYKDPGPSGTGFDRTDWDGWAIGGSDVGAMIAYSNGYASEMESVVGGRFIYKNHFFHRFPVQMSRTASFEFFNEYGKFRYPLDLDGNVAFNDQINVNHSAAEIEAIVNVAPTASNIAHKPPAGVAGEQLVVKEG